MAISLSVNKNAINMKSTLVFKKPKKVTRNRLKSFLVKILRLNLFERFVTLNLIPFFDRNKRIIILDKIEHNR